MPDSVRDDHDNSSDNPMGGWSRRFTVVVVLVMTISVTGSPRIIATADDKPKAAEPKAASSDEATKTKTPEHEYVRIRKNEKGLAVALETSVITLENASRFSGASVDLIGAIHLGEPEYYSQLNELFKKYDVLLFEAVMPEEAVKQGLRPGGGDGSHRKGLTDEQEWTDAKVGMTAISVLQLGMKDALGMEFQLTGVDYTAENFVHADMTAEEFESSMSRRGESFSGMLLTEMGKSMAAQQEQNPIAMNLDLMLSALSSDRAYRIRRIAAVQLAKAGAGDAFAGFDGTSTIITERNKKCLDVMSREIKNGKKKIGIFYGAGHFADMEDRMTDEYGFQRTAEDWLIAWHLRAPETEKPKTSPPR